MKVLILIAFLLASLSNIYSNDKDTVWMRWYSDISTVRFTHNGNSILAVGNNKLNIINTIDGKLERTIDGVPFVKETYDRDYFIIGGYMNHNIVDVETLEPLTYFENDDLGIGTFGISKNGILVAQTWSSKEHSIRTWDFKTGFIINKKTWGIIDAENDILETIRNVDITQDGSKIIATVVRLGERNNEGDRKTIKEYTQILDAITLEQIDSIEDNSEMYLSQTGKYLAAKHWNLESEVALRVFDLTINSKILELKGRQDAINDVVFSPDDRYMVVAYEWQPGRIDVYDLLSYDKIYQYIWHPDGQFKTCSMTNDFLVTFTGSRLYLYNNSWLSDIPQEPIIDFTISPNPATDFINIETESLTQEIEIYNMLGIPVLKAIGSGQIDVSGLPRGVYYVTVGGRFEKVVLY